MGWFERLFSRPGSAERLYKEGVEKAKDKDYAGALANYTAAIESKRAPGDIKAMALFNRGLIYSLQGEQGRAEADLDAAIREPAAPAEVVSAAKEKRERLRRRGGRGTDR